MRGNMKLNKYVHVNEFFRRSVNIKSDCNNIEFLKGYICPKSSEEALSGLVRHIDGTGQSSFTWTGPYGSGKSSLVLLLSSILSSNQNIQKVAYSKLSAEAQKNLKDFFGKSKKEWKVVPIIGEPISPFEIVSSSVAASLGLKKKIENTDALLSAIKKGSEENAGVIIFVDEMGKFLEASSDENKNSDIYLFQQLAELANSSSGKIILIGILHQSFSEYSRNLSRLKRDEWTKIQGRFVDFHINTAGEEQLELISRAIISDRKPKSILEAAQITASEIKKNKPINEATFAKTLNACWPLHPIVASLLGPISRRRFGQNQRSIFSFLNSAEPCGFKEFINETSFSENLFYYPDNYWDYIQHNLESSIIASSDSKLWALANDAISKCKALGASNEHIKLLKIISVIDIFKGRSGLTSSKKILESCNIKSLDNHLKDLQKWAIVRFKKHSNAYSIFDGSDFDLDSALDEALKKVDSISYMKLSEIASFKPMIAKRHYHQTGALRWVDINIVPSEKAEELIVKSCRASNAFGSFFVILPSSREEYNSSKKSLSNLSKAVSKELQHSVACGVSEKYENIVSYCKELLALEWIEQNRNEMLDGDSVARREVEARKSLITSLLEELLNKQLTSVSWVISGEVYGSMSLKDVNKLISDIADTTFSQSPIVRSEMLNRDNPSSNANAALNALLRALITKNGTERLGISGYPPEGGLFRVMLEDSELYTKSKHGWELTEPEKNHSLRFDVIWKESDRILSESTASLDLSSLFEIWKKPPFGIKAGLLPFFATAYLLTRKDTVALYISGTYRPDFDDLFLDYLLRTPQVISMRWVNYDKSTLRILNAVKEALGSHNSSGLELTEASSAFETARSLVSLVDNLNPWVHRTRRLSKDAIRLREAIKSAHDPNKLLFDDLPNILGVQERFDSNPKKLKEIGDKIAFSISELTEAYPILLKEMGELLLNELQVGVASKVSIARLKERAKCIQGATGDFRVDALSARLITFEQTFDDIAGIASLAANKPIKDWIDLDIDRAKQEIVSLCASFKKAELLSRVKGRKTNRHAFALITAMSGEEIVYDLDFDLLDDERDDVYKIKRKIKSQLSEATDNRKILAALAEIGAEYISTMKNDASKHSNKKIA